MSEPEKKRRLSSLWKSKDSTGKPTPPPSPPPNKTGSTAATAEDDGGPRGGRRRLFTQLSEAEKSQRRSTLGSATLSQTTTSPAQFNATPAVGQLASATSASKGVLFKKEEKPAAAAPEIETQFAKMVRQSTAPVSASSNSVVTSGALSRQSTPDGASADSSATGSRRSSSTSMSVEEKKQRRKSLLTPVQNLFEAMRGESSPEPTLETDSKDKDKKKKGSIFGTKRDKGLDFQTTLQLDDSQAKAQKERQKKLQKELDKIEKEKLKQEKVRQSRLLDVLQQTLELGEERAQLPMPSHRNAFALPMRPPVDQSA